MIGTIALAASQILPSQQHKVPVSAVEWIDSYSDCLHVNASVLIKGKIETDRTKAARRAVVRCQPVRTSARGKIVAHLIADGRSKTAGENLQLAESVLHNAAKAFALDFNLPLAAIGPLDPR
ncbi:MAG: hypothetical protein EOP09_01630 [Proteobacteria bacterium]|nr:MAG: hypothetical protein EOP09_01630 [Pseudomonadota bacterium]